MSGRRSGWCGGVTGACVSKKEHSKCGERLRRGLLRRCECQEHGGHEEGK